MSIPLLTFLLPLVLFTLAALHAYWGLGGRWPGHDELSLARSVVGSKGITRMPSSKACFAVMALLIGVGLWPLFMAGVLPALWPNWLTLLAGWGFVLVFVGRGLAAYVPAFRLLAPEEPFASLDRQLYAPLCLALGGGFLFLLL
jgi:Protein of unknown function (DUF3995)